VTDEALALAFRSGLPFVGLRDHASNPDLDLIVPPDAARTARALPLAAQDDHIRLAVADPDADLSALNPYLTGRQVDLALAPREELDAILGPPPPVAEPEQAAAEAPEQLAGEDEPEPVEADQAAPAEAAEPEPVEADQAAPAEAVEREPVEADHTASADAAEPEPPAVSARGEEPEPPREPDPGALSGAGASDVADEVERGGEMGGEVGPIGQAAVEPSTSGDPESAGVVAAEPGPPVDDHPELAGEVPSWLEPPRRGRRVLVTVLIVIVVLALAAAVVVAFLNA
jgi:hypothetical protein